MNDKMQEAITAFIEKALNGSDAAGDFMVGEIPEVINQLLVWHGIESFLIMIMSLPLIMSPLYVKANWDFFCKNDIEPFSIFVLIPFLTGCIIFEINWLVIIVAPKLYLLEYAASIVK